MTFLKSVVLAFSMFSRIPMPRVAWNEKNLRYLLCAFPLVGVAIACVCGLWFFVCAWLVQRGGRTIPLHLSALVFTLIPVLVTGGIHLDGFMDTCDALASHADREKKLAIMQDSHAGAFAVLGCVLYFLSYAVLLYEWCDYFFGASSAHRFVNFFAHCRAFFPVLLPFVLSRLLSAFSVATFPIAKDSGLVRTFSDASAKRFTALWCACWFMAISVAAVVLFGRSGEVVVCAQLAVFAWYAVMTKRNFGGITGDTAGWFVQMAELASLVAIF